MIQTYQPTDKLFELSVMVDWKTQTIYFNTLKVSFRPKQRQWIKLPSDIWTTPGKAGFDALHEKLTMLANAYKFDVNRFIELIATTGIIRKTYLVKDCGIPPYVAMVMLNLLQEYKACNGSSGGLRKTIPYVMFLRQCVNMQETMASVTSGNIRKYQLPQQLDEMTVEMIGEELRVAEELGAKASIMGVLRNAMRLKQHEANTVTIKGKTRKKTEFEQLQDVMREARAEDATSHGNTRNADEAQYDDVQPSKTRRKSP